MNIIEVEETPANVYSGDYHILTFAETGFAVLSYCAEEFGLGKELVERFSDQVNETNETGSLHPKAPISAVPRHLIRESNDSDKLASYIREFLEVNHRRIKAKRLIIDFTGGLAPFVTAACRNTLDIPAVEALEEVIIVVED